MGVAKRYLEAREPLRAFAVLTSAKRWRAGKQIDPLLRRAVMAIKTRLRTSLEIIAPKKGQKITDGKFSVRGRVLDPAVVRTIQVEDRAKASIDGDEFSASVSGIDDGARPLRVVASADIQHHGEPLSHAFSVFVIKDTKKPVIQCEGPKKTVLDETLKLEGHVEDATQITLRIGGEGVKLRRDGTKFLFQHDVTAKHGNNAVELVATDAVGNRVRETITFQADLKGAGLKISPSNPTAKSEATIRGLVEPGSKVTIDGKNVPVDGNGRFSLAVELKREGDNSFQIQATSASGKAGEAKKGDAGQGHPGPGCLA